MAKSEGGLKGDLGLANTAEALDGGPLAGIVVGAGWDPIEQAVQNIVASDEAFVSFEGDRPVILGD